MALIFDRKNMMAGVAIVRELVPSLDENGSAILDDGKPVMREKEYRFTRNDLGKKVEFYDEAKVLARYPVLFKKA